MSRASFFLSVIRGLLSAEGWGPLSIVLVLGVLPQVLPIISASTLAGWDTHGHLFMVEKMATFIRQGALSGYVLEWEGGFPAFTLYPPLFFIVASLPAVILPSLISTAVSFYSLVFVLPFLLAVGIFGFARTVLPREAWGVVPILILVYLLLPGLGAHGVGMDALLFAGLVPSFFALVLFVFFAWSIEVVAERPSPLRCGISGVLLAALFLSHTLTSVFAGLYLGLRLVAGRPPSRLPMGIVVMVGVLGSLWWTVPFVRSLPYSSGEALLDWNPIGALSVFFPLGPAVERQLVTGALERSLLGFEQPLALSVALRWGVGLFFLVTTSAGIISSLRRGALHLPLLFLVGAALVPGDFIVSASGLPLHSYRFSAALWVIEIVLSAEGCARIFQMLPHYAEITRRSVIGVTAIVLSLLAWNHYLTLSRTAGLFLYRANERQSMANAEHLLKFLADNRPKGRVAVESDRRSLRLFGSPHFLLTEIPRRLGIPTVPGLYAEGSLSSPFVTPTMAALGDQLVWGSPEIARRPGFLAQPPELMIDRLKLFGVEFIVATSGKMREQLQKLSARGVSLVLQNPDLGLYSLGAPRPLVDILPVKPFLYVEAGGIPFRAFAKWMFSDPELYRVPFIHFGENEVASQALEGQLSGVVISCGRETRVDDALIARWQILAPVVLVNCDARRFDRAFSSEVLTVPYLFREFHLRSLASTLARLERGYEEVSPFNVEIFSNETIKTHANGPLLFRINAARCWTERSAQRVLGTITPSHLVSFGSGDSELQYSCH